MSRFCELVETEMNWLEMNFCPKLSTAGGGPKNKSPRWRGYFRGGGPIYFKP